MKDWTIEDVAKLSELMKKDGISLLELHGVKLIRHPQQHFYEGLAGQAKELQGAVQTTDEEILFNPMAGLEGVKL